MPLDLWFPVLGYPFYMLLMTYVAVYVLAMMGIAGWLFILPLLAAFYLLVARTIRFIRDGGSDFEFTKVAEIAFLGYAISAAPYIIDKIDDWLFHDAGATNWVKLLVAGGVLAVSAYARRGQKLKQA